MNFPQNTRGFGPWANEQISYSEARKGSLFGLGFVDNPVTQTDAETRVQIARLHNAVRAAIRDAFNKGATREAIASSLSGNLPEDIRKHYLG